MRHAKDMDGSEAQIFTDERRTRVYKTIDFSHYSDFELMLDRITVHNATFPETAMYVEGFGVRDNAISNNDFVVIISQPFVRGTKPTPKQIEDGMSVRGYDKSENKFFFISKLDNTVITDIHDENAVVSPEGNLLVFDNEAFLKLFPVDSIATEKVSMKEFLPDQTGRFPKGPWKKLLGDKALHVSDQTKSNILKQLRLTGSYNALVDGKIVRLENAREMIATRPDGTMFKYYDGNISFGFPDAFKKERTWTIPPLQYNEDSVREIKQTIRELVPEPIKSYDFFHNPELVGHVNRETKEKYIEQLERLGRIEGPVNGRFIVQRDSEHPGQLIVSTKDKIDFMLWTNGTTIPGKGLLTESDKRLLAKGDYIKTPQGILYFNIDKGRVDTLTAKQQKLYKKIHQENKDRLGSVRIG